MAEGYEPVDDFDCDPDFESDDVFEVDSFVDFCEDPDESGLDPEEPDPSLAGFPLSPLSEDALDPLSDPDPESDRESVR